MKAWLLQTLTKIFSKVVLDKIIILVQDWLDSLRMKEQDLQDKVKAEEAIKQSREAKSVKEQEDAFKKTIDSTRPR